MTIMGELKRMIRILQIRGRGRYGEEIDRMDKERDRISFLR
jgi:hypothetical protein